MNNYNKSKHKDKISTAFDGAGVAGAPLSGAYLTRTNKSTSTSVNFELVLSKVDDFLIHSNRFARSLRSWIIDDCQKVVYE